MTANLVLFLTEFMFVFRRHFADDGNVITVSDVEKCFIILVYTVSKNVVPRIKIALFGWDSVSTVKKLQFFLIRIL